MRCEAFFAKILRCVCRAERLRSKAVRSGCVQKPCKAPAFKSHTRRLHFGGAYIIMVKTREKTRTEVKV